MKWLSRGFASLLLWVTGWKVEGNLNGIRKCVIIGAPHTSNWDLFYGMLFKLYFGLEIRFLMKKELFRFPLNYFYRFLGGIPVDRSIHTNLVSTLAERISRAEKFRLVITPEGTRKKNCTWKKGFYYIAREAGIPLVLGFLDYRRKIAGVGKILQPGSDMESDLNEIRSFYSGITAKYPDKFCLL
ncbi:MAG: 1-acyl-sn-glycerol-3-phosphate acyltransferase [Bacteroidales bacterium]